MSHGASRGLQWLAFAALVAFAVTLQVLYAVNMVAWRAAPDRGWIGSAETGPKVVAATRSAGAEAGLRSGDLILSINGRPYETYRELLQVLDQRVGAVNVHRVQRGAEVLDIGVPVRPLGLGTVLAQSGPNLFLGVVFLALGVIVFLMKPCHAPSWAFALLTTCLALVFPYSRSTYVFQPPLLNGMFAGVACLVAGAMLHLAATFPKRRRLADRPALIALCYALAAGVAAFTLSQGDWQDVGGWRRNLWYVLPLAGLLAFLGSTAATWLRSPTVATRLQSLVIFTGTLIAFLVPVIELVFARLFGMRFFPNVLYTWMPFVTAFPMAIGYAIVRHDLFEIDVFVRRTYGYLLSTALVILLYGATVSTLNLVIGPSEIARSPFFTVSFVLAVVFLMQPMQHRIQAFVDRAFYRQQLDYRRTITEVSERLTSLLEPALVRETLLSAAVDEMFLDGGALLAPEEGSERFEIAYATGAAVGRPALELDPTIRGVLADEHAPVFRHEIDLAPRFERARDAMRGCFDAFAAELMLPMLYQGELRGVVALGRKKSGKMFTREDVDLLRTLTAEGSVALENARLFDDLASSLKQVQLLESVKASLSKFVPRTVQSLIEESPDASSVFEKRERDLTVMFADMTGYTRLSAQLPLDQANAIVERYFGAYLDEILNQGGDVNETAGDGLMVLFQTDDPEEHARAAVRAALGIQRATREINAERTGEIQIGMHIGINSGIAAVGATKIQGGAGMRWTYTASGPTTNIAARVGALGEEIALTDATRVRLGEAFVLESVGEKTLKNVSDPVLVWRAVAAAAETPQEAPAPQPAAGAERPPEPVPRKAPRRPGLLRIHGTVLEAGTRRPLADLRVRAYDWDLLSNDVLGDATTDAEGRFEISFLDTFAGLLERKPDVFLRVFDASGRRELHSTRDRIRWNVERDESFALEIADARLPDGGT